MGNKLRIGRLVRIPEKDIKQVTKIASRLEKIEELLLSMDEIQSLEKEAFQKIWKSSKK